MTEPALGPEPGTGEASAHWPSDLDADYQLVGELGRGGMAVVFRARDRDLGRDVAIKVVRPRFVADEEAVARLAREARTVAQLEHPNIVGVHSIRHLSDRSVALVMQLIPGRTLKMALQQDGPFDPTRAEHVLRDIARALAYAHRAGVVHRDVKPENIFLDDVSGRVMLSDFGVARVMDAPTELTATGTTIGTPTYMAPEQIDGVHLDGRSDLYSLGMVGWEMLTAERPWAGESLYSVIYRQKHDPLPPLDAYRDDIPPRIQYLIEGLMHKSPDRRWSSAARFLTLLASEEALPGLREWQSAQRRRRRTSVYQQARQRGGTMIEAAFETVRFARGETPVSQPAAPAEETPTGEEPTPTLPPRRTPALTPIPAVITIPPRPSRRGLWVAVAVVTTLGGGVFAASRWRQPNDAPASAPATAVLGDRPGVELPVVSPAAPPIDSAALLADGGRSGAPDSVAAAVPGTPNAPATLARDSTRLVGPPANLREVTPNVAAPPRPSQADSVRIAVTADSPRRPPASPPAVAEPPVAGPPALSLAFPRDDRAVATGSRHSCLLTESGRAACWGANEEGQLGDGLLVMRGTAKPVAGDFMFTEVVAGNTHTCGLARSGDVSCWGSNGAGQLGDGTTSVRAAPVRLNSDVGFLMIRAGQRHTCGITRARSLLCWGSNTYGQLGDGSRQSRSSPVAVSVPGPVASLALGSSHSCAITGDGSAFCWGRNEYGQLGDGTTSDRSTPTSVDLDSPVVSVAAGGGHSCAVSTAGVAYCWGRGSSGQLGVGSFANSHSTPRAVAAEVAFQTIAAGSVHTCARGRDSYVWCWGRNANGQLGDGSAVDRSTPMPVSLLPQAVSIDAGGSHTCAKTGTGEAYCWGYNVDGQLGRGDRDNALAPTRVIPPPR